MDIKEKAKVVRNLQKKSIEVFNTVTGCLKIGMSEAEIADLVRIEFKKREITEFWYSIPINVLIGTERFQIGITTSDYSIKAPAKDIYLQEGLTVFIDLHPMDPKTKLWGDWASMIVFHPRDGIDNEQVSFLDEMRQIHKNSTSQITAMTTGADVANYYLKEFTKRGITLSDVRNNVGHSIHHGPKDKAQRIWLDEKNTNELGEGIFAVEPCGVRKNTNSIVVARLEECIYIPKKGNAIILN